MARWLKKLTPEQHAMLPEIRDEWIAHGLSTDPADRPAAEKAIRDLYVACGLEEPRFIVWMSSPWAGVVGAARLRRHLKDPRRIERLAVTSTTSPGALHQAMGDGHNPSFAGDPFDSVTQQVDSQIFEPLQQTTSTQIATHGEKEAPFSLEMTFGIQLSPELAQSVGRVLNRDVRIKPIESVNGQVEGNISAEIYEKVAVATSRADVAASDQVLDQVEAQIADEPAHLQVGWGPHRSVDRQINNQVGSPVYRDVKDVVNDVNENIGLLVEQVAAQVRNAHEAVDLDVAAGLREAVADQVDLEVRVTVNAQGETMMTDPRLVGGQIADQIGDAGGVVDLDVMGESTEAISDEVHVDVQMSIDEPRMRLAGAVGRLVDRGVSAQIGAQSLKRGPSDPVEKIVGRDIQIRVEMTLAEQLERAQRHLVQVTDDSPISVNQVQDQVAESVVDHLVERLVSRAADPGEMAASFMITDPVSEVRRAVVDAVHDQADAQVGDIVRADVDMFRGQVVVSHDQQIARDQVAEQVHHVFEGFFQRARFAVSCSVDEQVQHQIVHEMGTVRDLEETVELALRRTAEQQVYADPVHNDLRTVMVRAIAAVSSRVVESVIREIQELLGPVQSQIDVEIVGLEQDEHPVQSGLHQEWAEGLSRTELSDAFRARWWGSHAGWWCSWLDTYTRLGVKGLPTKAVDAHLRLGRSCGWWFPFRGGVVLTDRPSELHLDAPTNRWGARPLHNETGPALRYRDGYAIHVWHGTRVPAWVIEDPTPERIFAERNAEIRRCAIEVLGWHRLVDDMAIVHECPDPGNAPHTIRLYDMPEGLDVFGDTHTRVVVCTNGSPHRDGSRRDYGLTVPGDFENALAAAAWTYGLTPEKYATLRRRT